MEKNNSKTLIRKSIVGITTIACITTFHMVTIKIEEKEKALEISIPTTIEVIENINDHKNIDSLLMDELKVPVRVLCHPDVQKIIDIIKDFIGEREYIYYYDKDSKIHININDVNFPNTIIFDYKRNYNYFNQSVLIEFNNTIYKVSFNDKDELTTINYNHEIYSNDFTYYTRQENYDYENNACIHSDIHDTIMINDHKISLLNINNKDISNNTINVYETINYSGGTFDIDTKTYESLISSMRYSVIMENLYDFIETNYELIDRIIANNPENDNSIEAKVVLDYLKNEILISSSNNNIKKIKKCW